MQQVFFWLPIQTRWTPDGIPIFAYGTMLFLCFITGVWYANRRLRVMGLNVPRDKVADLIIILFLVGLAGARLTFMIQYKVPLSQFFAIWKGGIVLYGAIIGGTLAFIVFHRLVFRPMGIGLWKLGDMAAPTLCLGIAIGRVGCLLNGCCYGNPACEDCPRLEFPLMTAAARDILVDVPADDQKHYTIQSRFGFSYFWQRVDGENSVLIVDQLEPGSAAEASGLKSKDIIKKVKVQDKWIDPTELLQLLNDWPRGVNHLQFQIERAGEAKEYGFTPKTVGLHPTQLYETISMLLLFFVLVYFYPLRRHDGQVFVLWMVGYAFHRFLNEILRTEPVEGLQMTLSQLISVFVLAGAVLVEIFLRYTMPKVSDPAPPSA